MAQKPVGIIEKTTVAVKPIDHNCFTSYSVPQLRHRKRAYRNLAYTRHCDEWSGAVYGARYDVLSETILNASSGGLSPVSEPPLLLVQRSGVSEGLIHIKR